MIELRGDRITVDASKFHMPAAVPGVSVLGHRGTWPNAMMKADIRARLAGRPGAKYDLLGRHQERAKIAEAEHTRLYGPPRNLGVDRRGTPPSRAERRDPRWQIGPHWSGLPQRIVGVVGLPRPGKPRMIPRSLDYKGPWEYYWPTDTAEGLQREAAHNPQGWRLDPEKNCREGCMGPGPRPKNPHIGFWWDSLQQRLGEVYDPSESPYYF